MPTLRLQTTISKPRARAQVTYEYDGLVGLYDGLVGEYDGDVGLAQKTGRWLA